METLKCKFPTWTGICKKEANKRGYCLEHEKVKCAKCGKQATDFCDYAYSMAVCVIALSRNLKLTTTLDGATTQSLCVCRFYLTNYEYNSKRFDWFIRRR